MDVNKLARYRKYKRNGGGYLARFMSWFDTSSGTSKNSVFQFSVGGSDVKARLGSMFGAFKYYKILGHRITCIPAATLPGDPAQLSYAAGDYGIDFRDQLNVGLMRYTNGEPIPYMDKLLSSDASTAQKAYYALMMDPRWSKFGLQKGFKRFCKPLLWDDGLNIRYPLPDQIEESYRGNANDLALFGVGVGAIEGTPVQSVHSVPVMNDWGVTIPHRFQSGRKNLMGWLPTDDVIYTPDGFVKGAAVVPECPTLTVILPKAFKTKFAFRFVVTTYVKFGGLKYENIGSESESDGWLPDSAVYGVLDDAPISSQPPITLGDGSS